MAVTGRLGARFVTMSMVAGDRRLRAESGAGSRPVVDVWRRMGRLKTGGAVGQLEGPAPQTKLGSWEAEASLVGAGINLSVGTVCHELN